jgi:hypothetical protein
VVAACAAAVARAFVDSIFSNPNWQLLPTEKMPP